MLLTKHKTTDGSRWAVDGRFLLPGLSLSALLQMRSGDMLEALTKFSSSEPAIGEEEAPIDPQHEVWAAGVSYLRSRDARKAESTVADMYEKVYEAARPELFSSLWAGACRETVDRSAFARIASGTCRNPSWCWSLITITKSSAIARGMMFRHEISKARARYICRRRKSITAPVHWDMVSCCAKGTQSRIFR